MTLKHRGFVVLDPLYNSVVRTLLRSLTHWDYIQVPVWVTGLHETYILHKWHPYRTGTDGTKNVTKDTKGNRPRNIKSKTVGRLFMNNYYMTPKESNTDVRGELGKTKLQGDWMKGDGRANPPCIESHVGGSSPIRVS